MSRTFVLTTTEVLSEENSSETSKKKNFSSFSTTRDTRPRERRRVKGAETRCANDKIGNLRTDLNEKYAFVSFFISY